MKRVWEVLRVMTAFVVILGLANLFDADVIVLLSGYAVGAVHMHIAHWAEGSPRGINEAE